MILRHLCMIKCGKFIHMNEYITIFIAEIIMLFSGHVMLLLSEYLNGLKTLGVRIIEAGQY